MFMLNESDTNTVYILAYSPNKARKLMPVNAMKQGEGFKG
jgi:hypothetical protein